MKGLKKIALASAVAAVSAGAQAELKALDDSAMGELTGQAGLTIDIETKYTIGEFQYKDAGSVFFSNMKLGGNENVHGENTDVASMSYLDNFRLTLDVAGAGAVETHAFGTTVAATGQDNTLVTGFAEVRGLAAVHADAGADGGFANTNSAFAQAAGGAIAVPSAEYVLDAAASGVAATANANRVGVADHSQAQVVPGAVHSIDNKKVFGDGDLVIHLGFSDAWQTGGGLRAFQNSTGSAYDAANPSGPTAAGTLGLGDVTFAQAIDVAMRAVDFNFSIDAIGIASSAFVTGQTATAAGSVVSAQTAGVAGDTFAIGTDLVGGLDADASTTVLISNLDVNGYLGPVDIHIENNGNGFGNGAGYGDADSKINWDTYYNITDLDIFIDIAGVMIEGLKINNTRGDVTGLDDTFAFGFAHSKRDIYAVKDDVVHVSVGSTGGPVPIVSADLVDAVAINTQTKYDMDIEALSFGDTGTSIGQLYWTDVETDTKWTISAH